MEQGAVSHFGAASHSSATSTRFGGSRSDTFRIGRISRIGRPLQKPPSESLCNEPVDALVENTERIALSGISRGALETRRQPSCQPPPSAAWNFGRTSESLVGIYKAVQRSHEGV